MVLLIDIYSLYYKKLKKYYILELKYNIKYNMVKVKFEILDWDYFQDEVYYIRLFGRTIDNKTIYLQVNDFYPEFYVEVFDNIRKYQIEETLSTIKYRVPEVLRDNLIHYDLVKKHKFFGFTNNKDFTFLRLVFNNFDSFKAYARAFFKPVFMPLMRKEMYLNLYESNIIPFLRFMHIQNLKSVGWVNVENIRKIGKISCCELNYEASWKDVTNIEDNTIQKFVIASFDIECVSCDGTFPQPKRESDQVIQIGITYSRYGEDECFHKHILTLKKTSPVDGATVECFKTETELLLAFTKHIREYDPDIITGYNIFGFDFNYLKKRSKKLGIYAKFSRLSRINNEISEFKKTELSSSALGDNILRYYKMTGRVLIDLYKVIQRDYKLQSYKLDNVASNFIRDSIVEIQNNDNNTTTIKTKNTYGLTLNQYISIAYYDNTIEYKYLDGKKFKIIDLTKESIIIEGTINKDEFKTYKLFWCQNKDDVLPNDIFRMFKQTSNDRSIIAKYCIQDCVLCNKLINKLQIITSNMSLALVCNVPFQFIFLRGQSIKIFSLVAKKCREKNFLIPTLKKDLNKDKTKRKEKLYEGAIVFEPKIGVHFEPIIVLDFSSLYPNSMIFNNLSHETLVIDKDYDDLPEYKYNNITFKDNKGANVICRFAERKDGKKGILPEILLELLSARKKYKGLMETETDNFKKAIWNHLQLAYKTTANSLYGQTGAETSNIFLMEIAASTTATGRNMLEFSRNFIENEFSKLINLALKDKEKFYMEIKKYYTYYPKILVNDDAMKIPEQKFNRLQIGALDEKIDVSLVDINVNDRSKKIKDEKIIDELGYKTKKQFFDKFYVTVNDLLKGYNINLKIIYGDTDSVFICTEITNIKTHEKLKDINALNMAIKIGIWASIGISTKLPPPMVQEYEKVLWPLVLLSKKRYVGNLYVKDVNKPYQKSMGIVLQRRDNALIVKIIFSGIINQILNKHDSHGAINYTKETLLKIISGKFGIDKFIITKALSASYKNPSGVVQKVLADRIAQRDPGNAPQINDRIAYIYFEKSNMKKKELQGERVETPEFIIKNNLKIDYLFYITNQIMKPVLQILELISKNPKELFNKFITIENNKKKKIPPITCYFSNSKNNNKRLEDYF